MIFPNVSVDEWCRKYKNLQIDVDKCDTCERTRRTSIPFIEKGWVGLLAPICPCGNGGDLAIQIPTSHKTQNEYDQIINFLST